MKLEKMVPSGVKEKKLDADRAARTLLPVEFRGAVITFEARAYQGLDEHTQAMALINRDGRAKDAAALGLPIATKTPLVRVHSGCVTGDIFHSLRCDCRAQLEAALEVISQTQDAILIYLPYQEGRGIGLFNKIKAYALQDEGFDTVDANLRLGEPVDAREYELAAEILQDLGVSEIRLMTNNPAKVSALNAAGIAVIEQMPLVVAASPYNKHYLETKRLRMDHRL